MQLAFWNSGAPILVNVRQVRLANGNTVFNAVADPANDLYDFVEVGGRAGEFQTETVPIFAVGGSTITATRTVTYLPIDDIRAARSAQIRNLCLERLLSTDWEVLAGSDAAREVNTRAISIATKVARANTFVSYENFMVALNAETDPETAANLQVVWGALPEGSFDFSRPLPPKLIFIVEDQKPSGTAGGTFTAGAWRTRDLNTITFTQPFASLAVNQITLDAGTYFVMAEASAFLVGGHRVKLVNMTDMSTLVLGLSAYLPNTAATVGLAVIRGIFTLSTQTAIELQHMNEITSSPNGFGAPVSDGALEIYSNVIIEKIG